MFSNIFRAILRPARPSDDDHSSLHVHVDVDRQKDQEYWERERERERDRERRRAARSNARQSGSNSAIELTPRYNITYGNGTGSTYGIPSVDELVAPVLDRKAIVFPAHGVGAPSSLPLNQRNSIAQVPSVSVPAKMATTSATFNMAESHDYFGDGDINLPSAEECMAIAAAEAARQREEEEALSAPAPPLPSQSPVISEMDYRMMNLSPGPDPSFIEEYNPPQPPPTTVAPAERLPTSLAPPLQQHQPVIPQKNPFPPDTVIAGPSTPHIGAAAKGVTPTKVPVSGGGGVAKLKHKRTSKDGNVVDGKVKKKISHKDKSRHSHELPNPQKGEKGKGKEKENGKEKTKDPHRVVEKDKEKKKDRDKPVEKSDKREREKKEKKDKSKRDKHKHRDVAPVVPQVGVSAGDQQKKHSSSKKTGGNVLPAGLSPAPVPILKPYEKPPEKKKRRKPTEGGKKSSRSHRDHHIHKDAGATDPETGKKKVTVETPDEEAARKIRKQERAKAKEIAKAAQQNDAANSKAGGNGKETSEGAGGKDEKHRHRGKSSKNRDGEHKHHRRKSRENESQEERSQRRAARRARKLEEALKAENSQENLEQSPPSEGYKRQSTQMDFSIRILSPVPEGSLEPPESVPLPLSPYYFPTQPSTPVPDLPELPRNGLHTVPSMLTTFGGPVAYTEAQLPPRPATPPPGAYSSHTVASQKPNGQPPPPERRRTFEEKIVVDPQPLVEAESSRRRPKRSKVTEMSQAPTTSSESKEERRKRKADRAAHASMVPLLPPPAAIVPPDEARAAKRKSKRTPEESEARRMRREARKLEKLAAANAALHAIDENQAMASASSTRLDPYLPAGTRAELSAYQANANALRANSVIGLHQPDPRTEPGYGHYGYLNDINTTGLTSPPPGRGPKHKKSVTIDVGARREGPGYGRGREREQERIKEANAASGSGKRFGMFSLKRSFSKLFRQ